MSAEMDWSYVSGFFDGEGCVFIGRNNRPVVTVSQTVGEHNVLEKLKAFLQAHGISSANIYSISRKHHNPKWKDAHTLQIGKSKDVEIFLRNCLPHLIVKVSKATEALSLITNQDRKWCRQEDVRVAIEEYAQGATIEGLRRKYGIGAKTLRKSLVANGIRVRKTWENGALRDPLTGRMRRS